MFNHMQPSSFYLWGLSHVKISQGSPFFFPILHSRTKEPGNKATSNSFLATIVVTIFHSSFLFLMEKQQMNGNGNRNGTFTCRSNMTGRTCTWLKWLDIWLSSWCRGWWPTHLFITPLLVDEQGMLVCQLCFKFL